MRTTKDRWYAVVLADVINSRRWPGFASLRDPRMQSASRAHRRHGWTRFNYTVTTWDEFQNVAADPRHLPRIVFDLRRRFRPAELRIGIGVGDVDLPLRAPLNQRSSGEAFVLAREALGQLDGSREQRQGRITWLRSASPLVEELGHLIFSLQDPLVQRVTMKQWQTIDAFLETPSQEAAARRLRVDKSTVSRNLRRACYWQIEASVVSAGNMIDAVTKSCR